MEKANKQIKRTKNTQFLLLIKRRAPNSLPVAPMLGDDMLTA